jgi:hypothetical protein
MKWSIALAVAFMFSVSSFSAPSFANPVRTVGQRDIPDNDDGDGSKLTPQQRADSNALMQQGLTQLQASAGALQSGNAQGALQSLRSAFSEMRQAQPIYHGHRKDALIDTRKAGRALDANTSNSASLAASFTTAAISEAETALKDG